MIIYEPTVPEEFAKTEPCKSCKRLYNSCPLEDKADSDKIRDCREMVLDFRNHALGIRLERVKTTVIEALQDIIIKIKEIEA